MNGGGFDGRHHGRKDVNLGGRSNNRDTGLSRDDFVKRKKQERQKREQQRKELEAANHLQKSWRGYVDVEAKRKIEQIEFDKRMNDIEKVFSIINQLPPGTSDQIRIRAAPDMARKLNFFFRSKDGEDKSRLRKTVQLLQKLHIEDSITRLRTAGILNKAMAHVPDLVPDFINNATEFDSQLWQNFVSLLDVAVVCDFLVRINNHDAWVLFLPQNDQDKQAQHIASYLQAKNTNLRWALEMIQNFNLSPPSTKPSPTGAQEILHNITRLQRENLGNSGIGLALPWILYAQERVNKKLFLEWLEAFASQDHLRAIVSGPNGLQNIIRLFFSNPEEPRIPLKVLQILAFSTDFLNQSLNLILQQNLEDWRKTTRSEEYSLIVSFCMVMKILLQTMDDHEFQISWSGKTTGDIILLLISLEFHWITSSNNPDAPIKLHMTMASEILKLLFERHLRKSIITNWICKEYDGVRISTQQFERCLDLIPFAIPFEARLQNFANQLMEVANTMGATSLRGPFDPWSYKYGVRRQYIMEDGFKIFEKVDQDLHGNLKIEFLDSEGSPESGIDGGGLFKEFLSHLCRAAFTPERGLFMETHEKNLVPNPNAKHYHENYLELFHFLGKVIGKAMYEMVLLEPQFGHTFLNPLLDKPNSLEDLYELDPELARNLAQLKDMDVIDLGLTFSITNSEMSITEEIDLEPNGRNIPVTNENKIRYIHMVSNYRTNLQCKKECKAFQEGIRKAIDLEYLRNFSAPELNILISGSHHGFETDDLQGSTVYGGGYKEDSDVVKWFWEILEDANDDFRANFLMFCTSCSRGPLLGFKSLNPRFCIHRVPDNDRLPTASTCINLLKLPDYVSKDRLMQKLVQAISVDQGFHLS